MYVLYRKAPSFDWFFVVAIFNKRFVCPVLLDVIELFLVFTPFFVARNFSKTTFAVSFVLFDQSEPLGNVIMKKGKAETVKMVLDPFDRFCCLF